MDWTQLIIQPTANGNLVVKWYKPDRKIESEIFKTLNDALDFIEDNFQKETK